MADLQVISSLDAPYSLYGQAVPARLAQEVNAQEQYTVPREEWLRKAVDRGLRALEQRDFAPEERIRDIFARAGANVS